MRYSYIKPRSKKLISPEMKLLFFFFGITLFMLGSTYTFLLYKTFDFKQKSAMHIQQMADLNRSISELDAQIAFIQKEARYAEQVSTSNTVLKDSIKNLFDLVPERITLSKAEMKKDALILYGVTPNKEVYEFMLQAPLRSIFHRTYSSFYPLENGWYRFVSTNYLDEEMQ